MLSTTDVPNNAIHTTQPAVKPAEVNKTNNTEKTTLNDTQKLVLSNQSTILNSLELARVMADVFDKALPECLKKNPAEIDTLAEPEKYEQLVAIVRSLDVYFHQSPIHRQEQGKVVERWEAKDQIDAIKNLYSQQTKKITSVLKTLQLSDTVPLPLTEETNLLFPGAAIPRMTLRPQFAIDNNSDNTTPERLICLGSSRLLESEIDYLQDTGENEGLFFSINRLVIQFNNELGSKPTEAHAQMALMDRLRTDNPDCLLASQPVYLFSLHRKTKLQAAVYTEKWRV